MLRRLIVFATLLLIFGCASEPVSPMLMQGAACMADVLRGVSGASEVHIRTERARGSSAPVLEYSFTDNDGQNRLNRIMIYGVSGLGDERYIFDLAVPNDAVAQSAFAVWEIKCHAGAGAFHNAASLAAKYEVQTWQGDKRVSPVIEGIEPNRPHNI